MSIYATLWTLKFPKGGNDYFGCDWIEVFAQGVPAHVGSPTPGQGYEDGDPYADFLPPAIPVPEGYDGNQLRAVVIATEETNKVIQRYEQPLMTLTGGEYAALLFHELHERICDALRGDAPRVVAHWIAPCGGARLHHDDGSVRELPPRPNAT